MGTVFAQLLPELLEPIESALRSEGYVTQAGSLAGSEVERWTYDPSVNAGYIYLVQRKPVHHGETPAADTLAFMFDRGFNVDLRSHGEVFGIELLEHESIFQRLSAAHQS
jgi:uncharacterized protein YuzE